MIKRLFDVALAILLLAPALMLVLLAAILIKLESPGPAIFKQRRVGRHQKLFTMLKLRTMAVDTGDRASHEVSSLQITKTGKILRKTKIDELPQIWSVLVGDMSFVGPRPCLPVQTELIEARDRLKVFSVLPGITGPAQIKKIDMSTPDRLARVDGQYVLKQSLSCDLYYIFATAFGKGSGDAAL
tara:strand:+ start:594 stop:1148 length:555 start_codon:yes stop_codon:yes gene_type:complete